MYGEYFELLIFNGVFLRWGSHTRSYIRGGISGLQKMTIKYQEKLLDFEIFNQFMIKLKQKY